MAVNVLPSYNIKANAAEVYLVERWSQHTGSPIERRNKIFHEFVKLGMKGRWEYHRRAEDFPFSDEEKAILQCRSWHERSLADWSTDGLLQIVFSSGKIQLSAEQLEWCTGWRGEEEGESAVCADIDALPERVYTLTAYDDPPDAEEARQEHDQTHWVSGVYWVANDDLKLVWVDEFGETIREKTCDLEELHGDEALDRSKLFESSLWVHATKVGKYAQEEWWN